MNVTVKVEFKGVTVEMTPEEAKELIQLLRSIVGGDIQYYPYYPFYPNIYPITWKMTYTASETDSAYVVSKT
jgi:hypothetical protein